ncbi:hypothetical protein AAY473_039988 [Plecturocebus cupreus]
MPPTSSIGLSLVLSPGWSAVAVSQLTATSVYQVPSNSLALGSRVAETTGVYHHVQLIFVFLVETGFHHVGQDVLHLLTSLEIGIGTILVSSGLTNLCLAQSQTFKGTNI